MWLSIMGMYEYDNTIFNGLSVPDGIDKDAVINEILLQCSELEIIYTNIDTLKLAITVWSLSNQYRWKTLYKTMNLTYNPIWNVDAHESETFGQGRTHETTYDSTVETTYDSSDETTYDSTVETTYDSTVETTYDSTEEKTLDLTDTESVKGFNSSSWSNSKQLEKDGTDTLEHTGKDTVDHTGKDTVDHSGKDTVDYSGKDTIDHSGKDTISERIDNGTTRTRTGNIGVTTTQKMIQEERDIAEFSIISYITQQFKERFCLLVY